MVPFSLEGECITHSARKNKYILEDVSEKIILYYWKSLLEFKVNTLRQHWLCYFNTLCILKSQTSAFASTCLNAFRVRHVWKSLNWNSSCSYYIFCTFPLPRLVPLKLQHLSSFAEVRDATSLSLSDLISFLVCFFFLLFCWGFLNKHTP